MANEEKEFWEFINELKKVIEVNPPGKIYLVVDKISQDLTLNLCNKLSKDDPRFNTIWAPENKNVVDAYLKGLSVAFNNGHDFFIEMDAGLSHDPNAIPIFLKALNQDNECAFGSRFIKGGSMSESPINRILLSITGTILARIFLGSKLNDMTSGFQGFNRKVVKKILTNKFKSTGHFYQTELRNLLKDYKSIEIPIHYKAPSPRVNLKSIVNAISTLIYLSRIRIFKKFFNNL